MPVRSGGRSRGVPRVWTCWSAGSSATCMPGVTTTANLGWLWPTTRVVGRWTCPPTGAPRPPRHLLDPGGPARPRGGRVSSHQLLYKPHPLVYDVHTDTERGYR